MIHLFFALLLLWDAPTTNALPPCGDGAPLTDLDHYEVPIFRVSILGWATCNLEDGTPYGCPVYSWSLTRAASTVEQLSLADPGLGEVVGWEDVEAVDRAGNSSASCGAP